MQRIFDAISEHVLPPLDFELADILTGTLSNIFDMLLHKHEKDNIDISEFAKYERQLFQIITTSFGVFNVHSFFSKVSGERNTELKNV